jgi:hypothetical protein
MGSLLFVMLSSPVMIPCEYHIDCSGWVGVARVEFDVRVTAADGTVFTTGVELLPGSTAVHARDLIWLGLERAGWRGRLVGKGILVLEGSKGSAVRSVEFKGKDWKPDVRWVPLAPDKKK